MKSIKRGVVRENKPESFMNGWLLAVVLQSLAEYFRIVQSLCWSRDSSLTHIQCNHLNGKVGKVWAGLCIGAPKPIERCALLD